MELALVILKQAAVMALYMAMGYLLFRQKKSPLRGAGAWRQCCCGW